MTAAVPSSPSSTSVPQRDKRAATTAMMLTASHLVAGIIAFGWFYFVVPRWKKELDGLGWDLDRSVNVIITQSDLLVNFWYLLVPLAPVALVVDFIFLRWMAKYLGKTFAIVVGVGGAALILSGMWIGHSVLRQELSRLHGKAAALPVQMQPVENANP